MGDMIKITSLWKNKTKDGGTYLSGYLGDLRLMVFPNKHKKEDKHPDFNVYVAAKDKPAEGGGKKQGDLDNQLGGKRTETAQEDDIPF
jgi:hypothetical protein